MKEGLKEERNANHELTRLVKKENIWRSGQHLEQLKSSSLSSTHLTHTIIPKKIKQNYQCILLKYKTDFDI